MSAMNQLLVLLKTSVDAGAISITELADRTGVSRQHIYNVLSGKSVPTLDLAERMAGAIGHSIKVTAGTKPKKNSAVA